MDAEQWNARYPKGTRVMAYPFIRPDDPIAVAYNERRTHTGHDADPVERLDTVTRSVAWNLGHGDPVVMVEGYAGGIALTHIDPIPAATAGGDVRG
ncbi:hypothetical protein [Streptomyces sp. SP18BB07]|uniref:hypothetical protein n=1 Tax=Streptomyces sp. SP18BB07 TaxID=3002522 RepID=UPI002E75ACDC|nr:hypothetical protein [Streptomyces sp. SP18BB07]MEE1764370.1 hypothetical protein [Streptomyces sp. SP18BB07]